MIRAVLSIEKLIKIKITNYQQLFKFDLCFCVYQRIMIWYVQLNEPHVVCTPNQQRAIAINEIKENEEEEQKTGTAQENDYIDVNKNMSQRSIQTRGSNYFRCCFCFLFLIIAVF